MKLWSGFGSLVLLCAIGSTAKAASSTTSYRCSDVDVSLRLGDNGLGEWITVKGPNVVNSESVMTISGPVVTVREDSPNRHEIYFGLVYPYAGERRISLMFDESNAVSFLDEGHIPPAPCVVVP